MLNYVPLLSRAVDALDPNTAEARDALFERARQTLVDGLHAKGLRAGDRVMTAEIAALEAAIERVELEARLRAVEADREPAYEELPAGLTGSSSGSWRAIIGGAVALAVVVAGVAAYSLWPHRATDTRNTEARNTAPRNVAGKSGAEDQPATSIGYFYLRQPVYYRTNHPVGTIIVDKSQSFLYVVQPNVSALRYGIGIGPDCTATAGLYRIMQKEEWPGMKLSPERSADLAAERLKNPLGARALYLSKDYRIHGSNSPAWFGRPVQDGCIRLVNDDVIHLYDHSPLETRVVVIN